MDTARSDDDEDPVVLPVYDVDGRVPGLEDGRFRLVRQRVLLPEQPRRDEDVVVDDPEVIGVDLGVRHGVEVVWMWMKQERRGKGDSCESMGVL